MIGRTLSHFRIIAKIGEGGMGVVYKAEDVKLRRQVAIKVLPPHLLDNPERRLRFLREARTAAAVSHPNICHVYEIDEADGITFIAMEYLEGRPLRSLLAGRSLSIKRTLELGAQIVEGLAVAHKAMIVHRDLKPENIIVTGADNVKILDFGLAKLVQEQTETTLTDLAVRQQDTISDEVTRAGKVLGTAAYMSPEQAQAKPVDTRSDLFSFGIVLYEMATGRMPFHGRNASETLAAILHHQPSAASLLNAEVPAELDRILAKCLEKDPSDRYQDSRDLAVDLKHLKRDTESQAVRRTESAVSRPAQKARLSRAVWISTALVVAAAAISTGYLSWRRWLQPRLHISEPLHLQVTSSGGASFPAISPDGESLVYVTQGTSRQKLLMLRDLEDNRTIELFRADIISSTKWSPDGSELLVGAYVGGQRASIYLIPMLNRVPRWLSDGVDGCWLHDGSRIAAAFISYKGFQLIDKTTGAAKDVLVKGFEWVFGLDCSPTEDAVLLHTKRSDKQAILAASLDGSVRVLVENEDSISSPRWSAAGDAVYFWRLKGGAADLVKVSLSGRDGASPRQSVLLSGMQVGNALSLTRDGTRLVYTREQTTSHIWVARAAGSGQGATFKTRQLTQGTLHHGTPRLSPDGRQVAFARSSALIQGAAPNASSNLYVVSIEGGEPRQLTFFENSRTSSPAWSPDGSRIAFISESKVWMIDAGGGKPRQFSRTEAGNSNYQVTWSPDSRIVYQRPGVMTFHILDPDTEVETPLFAEHARRWMPASPVYSPDGRKLAVALNDNGQAIFVESLKDHSMRLVRKQLGEIYPIGWSPDGQAIYAYEWGAEATILSVSEKSGKTETLVTFPGQIYSGSASRDGRTFVCEVSQTVSDVWMVEHFDSASESRRGD